MSDKKYNGEKNKVNSRYLVFISLIAGMGGYLFGYDWVVIGGAKPFYEVYFSIAHIPWLQGWVMSSALLGCILGVIISGSLSDKYGRKFMMLLAAIIFAVSAFGTGAATTLNVFILFRIISGIGIGIASNISPMYLSEVSPPAVRGKFVAIYQLAVVLGILSAQVANWLIARPVIPGEEILTSWNGQMGWRWMFWVPIFPALLYLALSLVVPESPRWLVSRGNYAKATSVFSRIVNRVCAEELIHEIKESISNVVEAVPLSTLFKGRALKITVIGVTIAVLQQWCGINVVFNYAQEIFSAAGYSVSDMLFNIVITGTVNVIFTFVGMYTVDRLGRRSLMLLGTIGLSLIYAVLGGGFYFQLEGIPMLVLVVLAIACYAMTLAPVTWIVISEIFPTRLRAKGMAVSTFALWTASFLLTYTFPLLNSGLGAYGTFWLYGVICVAGFLFIRRYLPETKGKPLEEIERLITGE
ncbi:MAG: sugar porter family MFS transporter [Bacteroidota bacterium]|jgi:SP family sugar porter-like MFS transporter|nr:sugar porter family MFS transporter [Bacteroidota bacterium]HHU97128.1 sugar porter family MFS transporter [Petrimonas sp.]